MEDYIIIVNKIEELQTIGDVAGIEELLGKARRAIIGGNDVLLVRINAAGEQEVFDTLRNEADFELYRERVMKYM
ncbi:hypothetical protein MKQ68_09735 [Chitinophaga horti]|uniref:Uncharacterized protein n=1 Tax=Chitinophaga horti TaxID=2920382 RepID=A0ABY6J9Y3_9BACT|nr:hypothetical protein [Chitinophaga horti]UYQ95377.1 hypothetical protein MKQ68_09735 [Chitinophaga horti]